MGSKLDIEWLSNMQCTSQNCSSLLLFKIFLPYFSSYGYWEEVPGHLKKKIKSLKKVSIWNNTASEASYVHYDIFYNKKKSCKERSTLVQIIPKIATRCRISITKKQKSEVWIVCVKYRQIEGKSAFRAGTREFPPGNPRISPEFFIPVGSREFFRFPGKFREFFMYCE